MSRTNQNSGRNTGGMDGFVRQPRTRRPGYAPAIPQPQVAPILNRNLTTYPLASERTFTPRTVVPKRHKRIPLKRAALVLTAVVLLVGGWTGFSALHAVNKVFRGGLLGDAKALISAAPLNGEAGGRVNILLAGNSADDPNHGGADLTDSIMVLSVDTKHHSAFMLSVPRDLWVNIPGVAHQKINAANEISNFSQSGLPSGGMGQLQQIVQTDLGIPINYYALINYTAFRDAVNAVGGINVNIQSPDPRGLYDPNISRADGGPLLLANGVQTLNGQQALNLARARGDPCYCGHVEYGFPQSDFNRTQHQRLMLVGLEQKALGIGVLSNPLKVAQLFNSLGNNVKTNLSAENAMRLVQITKGLNLANVQSLAYTTTGTNALLAGYMAPDGEEALAPAAGLDEFGQLQQYYQQLVSSNPIVKEAPSVVVLNGTATSGLARREGATLKQQGFDLLSTSNPNATYASTMIIDNTGGKKPASKQALQHTFPSATFTTAGSTGEAAEATGYTADFVVVLGSNWNL